MTKGGVNKDRSFFAREHFFSKIVFHPKWKENLAGDNEEKSLEILKYLGYKEDEDFTRQYPIGKKFVIDFAFAKERIAIEIDGKDHNGKKQFLNDRKRDAFLQNNGWVSIRIKDKDMFGYKGSFYKNLIKEVVNERRKQYEEGCLYPIDIPEYVDKDFDFYE